MKQSSAANIYVYCRINAEHRAFARQAIAALSDEVSVFVPMVDMAQKE